MNGGGGILPALRRLDLRHLPRTGSASSRTRAAASSEGSRGSVPSNLSFVPSNETRRAGKTGGVFPSSSASTVQYSTGRNASICVLALEDDPQRHRLNPAGGEPAPDLLPEEVRDLVADEPVDDPAGLLRVDLARVDLARVLHRLQDRLLRDLVEPDALEERVLAPDALAGALQRLVEVPGDRLPFPVRVGRQVDGVGRPGGLLQVRKGLFLARQDLVGRLVLVGAVDPEALLGKVADVAVGGEDAEVLAEELFEGLRLGGRLDDDEGSGHKGGGSWHIHTESANSRFLRLS